MDQDVNALKVSARNLPTTRWVRAKDGVIAGVCAGIAKRLEVETWLVRFIWIMMVLFVGTGLLLYLALMISLPRVDRVAEAYERMILGVAAKLARRIDVEIGVVRLAWLIAVAFTFGAAVLAYIILAFLLPDPDEQAAETKKEFTRP